VSASFRKFGNPSQGLLPPSAAMGASFSPDTRIILEGADDEVLGSLVQTYEENPSGDSETAEQSIHTSCTAVLLLHFPDVTCQSKSSSIPPSPSSFNRAPNP
jgi:hypothetical protein